MAAAVRRALNSAAHTFEPFLFLPAISEVSERSRSPENVSEHPLDHRVEQNPTGCCRNPLKEQRLRPTPN